MQYPLASSNSSKVFSLRLGLPTMTCVQLGENPWDEHTSPPSSSTMAEYKIRSCGLMEDNRTLGSSFCFCYSKETKDKLLARLAGSSNDVRGGLETPPPEIYQGSQKNDVPYSTIMRRGEILANLAK